MIQPQECTRSISHVPIGQLAGDGISSAEQNLLDLISGHSGAGTALQVSQDLCAAANRMAQDIVHNRVGGSAHEQFLMGNLEGPYEWTSGGDLNSGIFIDLLGASSFVLHHPLPPSSDALTYFLDNAASAAAIADSSNAAIGIAEYAGVRVPILDDLRGDPPSGR